MPWEVAATGPPSDRFFIEPEILGCCLGRQCATRADACAFCFRRGTDHGDKYPNPSKSPPSMTGKAHFFAHRPAKKSPSHLRTFRPGRGSVGTEECLRLEGVPTIEIIKGAAVPALRTHPRNVSSPTTLQQTIGGRSKRGALTARTTVQALAGCAEVSRTSVSRHSRWSPLRCLMRQSHAAAIDLWWWPQ